MLEDGRVLYGLDPGALTSSLDDPQLTLDHEFVVSGLQPDTKYYYAIGNSDEILAGADLDHYFITSPVPGTPKPTRIWVLGDSGTGNQDAMAVRDAYYEYSAGTTTDLWLMLGDNAYEHGTDVEHQERLFDMQTDPDQYTNLASNPEYKAVKQRLHKRLMQRIKKAKS